MSSFSISFSLHASRSIFRLSFSNSFGSVARVALPLFLVGLLCLFPDVPDEIEETTDDKVNGVDDGKEHVDARVEVTENVAGIGDTDEDDLAVGMGGSDLNRDGIGGPDQANVGKAEH